MAAFFRSVYHAFHNRTSPPKKTESTFEQERIAFIENVRKRERTPLGAWGESAIHFIDNAVNSKQLTLEQAAEAFRVANNILQQKQAKASDVQIQLQPSSKISTKADLLKVLDVNSNIRQQSALFQAIEEGNLQAVYRIIIENPQLVHARNEQGQTPLHCAIVENEPNENNFEIAELLIQYGAAVNAKDNQDQTPLHYAIDWEDSEITELLIQCGADVNAKDNKQKTPRDYAEEKQKTNPEIAKLVYWGPLYRDEEQLFRAILRINYQKLGVDRLMRSNDKLFDGFGRAIYNIITMSVSQIGEEEAINAFRISAQILQLEERLRPRTVEDIEKEIKNELLYLYEDLYICFTGTIGSSPLRSGLLKAFSLAPYITKKFTSTRDSSSIELWQKHVKENFPPNGERKTAEAIRERTNRNRIAAAAVAAISMEQREKFFWAINRGDLRSVTKYLQRNSLLAHIKNDKNQTPLHYAMDQENPDIVKFLVKEGANINAQDFLGRTPLHYVIKGNDLEKAKLLIAHGAVINVKNNDGQTPLHYALEANPKMAKILVDYCATKSVPNKKGRDSASIRRILTLRHATVFYDIQENNFQRFERFIHKNPYLVFIRNKQGQTPLHIAIKLNRLDMVKLLIEKGAEVNAKDFFDKTPLDFAVDEKVIELLAKNGATKGVIEIPAENLQKEDKEKEEIAAAVKPPEAIEFIAERPSVASQPNSPLLPRHLSAPNRIGNKKDRNSDHSLSELENELAESEKKVSNVKAPSSPPPFRPIDIDLPDRLYKLYAFFFSPIESKQQSASQCQSEVDKVIHARTDSSILGQ